MNISISKTNKQIEETKSDSGSLEVDSARAVAQIQGAMAIAKKFPRDENQAINRITQAARRRKVAEQSEYEYTKGGASVSGASIRAAEVISQSWGNMISGVTEVVRDGDKRESLMLAYAADLETNNWKFIEWRIPHTIDTRNGAKKLDSGRDIYERVMNDASRRLRNCLLAVIPSDITDLFLEECNKTLNQDEIPLKERLSSMCAAMNLIGVTQPMIENKMGCSFSAISERQLSQLRRIYQSIKDGFGKIPDYFKESEGKIHTESFIENLSAKKEPEAVDITPQVVIPVKVTPIKKEPEKKVVIAPKVESIPVDEQGAFTSFETNKQASVKDRSELILKIMDAADKIRVTKDQLNERCKRDYNGIMSEVSIESLQGLLKKLEDEYNSRVIK